MKYGAPTIAHFAKVAGFAGADLHTATAIALAASGGIDVYDLPVGAPGAGRYVGLWAVNIDEWTDYTADELHDPQRAAQVAYDLTRRTGGFGWSPVWRAGADRRYLEHAIAVATHPPFLDREPAPNALAVYDSHITQSRERVRARSIGAQLWPTPSP